MKKHITLILVKASNRQNILNKIETQEWARSTYEAFIKQLNKDIELHAASPLEYLKGMPFDWDAAAQFPVEKLQGEKIYMKRYIPGFENREYTSVLAPPTFQAPESYDGLPTPTLDENKQLQNMYIGEGAYLQFGNTRLATEKNRRAAYKEYSPEMP